MLCLFNTVQKPSDINRASVEHVAGWSKNKLRRDQGRRQLLKNNLRKRPKLKLKVWTFSLFLSLSLSVDAVWLLQQVQFFKPFQRAGTSKETSIEASRKQGNHFQPLLIWHYCTARTICHCFVNNSFMQLTVPNKHLFIMSDPPSKTSNSCQHPPVVIDPTSETSSIHVEASREQGDHKIVTCTCTCTCTCTIYNVMYCDNFNTANTETPSVSMDPSDLTNSAPSTVPPLQSLIYLSEQHCEDLRWGNRSEGFWKQKWGIRITSQLTLTWEMEVQGLINRVTVLEDVHAHILEMQMSILVTQEKFCPDLLLWSSRMSPWGYWKLGIQKWDELSFDESSAAKDMLPHSHIPPPPAHHPPPPPHLPRHHPPAMHSPPAPAMHPPHPPRHRPPAVHSPPTVHPPPPQVRDENKQLLHVHYFASCIHLTMVLDTVCRDLIRQPRRLKLLYLHLLSTRLN